MLSTRDQLRSDAPNLAATTTLAHGRTLIAYQIPPQLQSSVESRIPEFNATLDINAVLSKPELAADFLAYWSKDASHHLQILRFLISDFETRFLQDNDIHSLGSNLDTDPASKKAFIRNCFTAYQKANVVLHKAHQAPGLFQAAIAGHVKIYAIFGGQGNTKTLLEDINDICTTYGVFVSNFLADCSSLLLRLSLNPEACDIFDDTPLDLVSWLDAPETAPDDSFMINSSVSVPLIGLLQLLHFVVTCKCLDTTPGEFCHYVQGFTGHSQGVLIAAFVSAASSWESFQILSEAALTALFWTGLRCQQAFPQTWLSSEIVGESAQNGEGSPTPMLSVRGLPLKRLEKEVQCVNKHLISSERVQLALINDNRNNLVVAGPVWSLCALNRRLRHLKMPAGEDETRTPFSQRKMEFTNHFLPVSVPFHTKLLASTTPVILSDLQDTKLLSEELKVAVFHSSTGQDLRIHPDNLMPELIAMITEKVVNWPLVADFLDATHFIDFGPGGHSGIGVLTSRMKIGTGVHVILADTLHGPDKNVLYKPTLYSSKELLPTLDDAWAVIYQPRLICMADQMVVNTPLTRLLGVPPLIVGGMTPTTAHVDFVATVMQAGYHIELASGGFHDPAALENAIQSLAKTIPRGRGITINLVYAAPRAIAWQVPLISRMISHGFPIDGLTIGAGVPSLQAVETYFKMGLRHISFKPGSTQAIDAVLEIARTYSNTAVILQWTGGRGGGHHSCEDFHVPILQRYADVRRHKNVLLIAGSGFGGPDDTYPYLIGSWATKYGYPPMPFDGFLFGSRMMIAKEAHTSPAAKQAIIEARGVSDSHWEITFAGLKTLSDIINIVSEMGEPMHVVATRGARLWAELDDKVFSKPIAQQLSFLKANSVHIIGRLDKDFQKVWFPYATAGAVNLSEMTYSEVVSRLFQLLSVEQDSSLVWIDESYYYFVADFLHRIEERSARCSGLRLRDVKFMTPSSLQKMAAQLFFASPTIRHQLLVPEDIDFFLQLCQRKGYKPVPFIPVLDENFETYFKKDSLWQSENLEKVVGKDAGRVIILHGPVAAQYCNKEESVTEILGGIHNGLVESLVRDGFANSHTTSPAENPDIDMFSQSLSKGGGENPTLENTSVTRTADQIVLKLPNSTDLLPSTESFHRVLGGMVHNWRRAVFSSNVILCGKRFMQSQIKRIFTPAAGQVVVIEHPDVANQTRIVLKDRLHKVEAPQQVATILFNDTAKEVGVHLRHRQTISNRPAVLVLRYAYHPETVSAPLWEVLDNRIERIKSFYWQLWYGDEPRPLEKPADAHYHGETVTLSAKQIRQFTVATGNHNSPYDSQAGGTLHAPLDIAFIVAWKALMKPLFALDLDLLKLVHLDNEFNMLPGAAGLQHGNSLTSTAKKTMLINQESGVIAEVTATVYRHDCEVLKIKSRFLYRNVHAASDKTFQTIFENPLKIRLETECQVAVLISRKWFKISDSVSSLDLLGKTLVFHLQTFCTFASDTSVSSTITQGNAFFEKKIIGSVDCHSCSSPNLAMTYLRRHGEQTENTVALKSSIVIQNSQGQNYCIKLPSSNVRYAQQSGDFNPIHTSRAFAAYVDLPNTITHGMYTSAAIRGLLERLEAGNAPQRIRKYSCSFQGMAVPGDELKVSIEHIAMRAGRKIFKLEARNTVTEELVLSATAEVEQAATAYIFTGQGSQKAGMGMNLRVTSSPAAAIWKRADTFFEENYGFAITSIVRDDPKALTIHFGGALGRGILKNYLAIINEAAQGEYGNIVRASKMFQTLTEPRCRSYTFNSHLGLLSATQFTQPALVLMEAARFADMQARGLVPASVAFAGHSLGEYGALSTLGGGFLTVEKIASITFMRGLTMQLAVERDEVSGKSEFSMCAVNPLKVDQSGKFDESALKLVVAAIVTESGWLLEVVNYNIAGMQYICAGHVRALACITNIINQIIAGSEGTETWTDNLKLQVLVSDNVAKVHALPGPLNYERGLATVPLKQIDVPFHSSYLAGGVDAYGKFLRRHIRSEDIKPEALVGKWIPNITGKCFGISKNDFEDMYKVTGSKSLRLILDTWQHDTI